MKNLKFSIAYLAIVLLSLACSRNRAEISKSPDKMHNLEAEIKGLGDDTILVAYYPLAKMGEMFEPVQDTIMSAKDRFTYDVPNAEPALLYLFPKKGEFIRRSGRPFRPGQKYIVLLLKPESRIVVKGELKDLYLDYEAKGDEFNEQYAQVRKGYIEANSQAVTLELELDSVMSGNGDKKQIEELFRKRNEVNGLSGAAHLGYIKGNLDKDLSAFYLTSQPLETVGEYYSKLSADVRGGLFKGALENEYNKYLKKTQIQAAEQRVKEGEAAPAFVLPSLQGDFSLADVKAKYTVLDFWGSWCPPCLKGLPKMKDYYSRYKGSVEFIGIDCNESEEKWRNAVEKYEMPWIQVMNSSDLDKDVSVMYGVQNFPSKFILDKDKRIIARFMGETEDFYKKLDELIAEK